MFITAHKPLAVFVAQAVFVVVFPPVFAVVRLINYNQTKTEIVLLEHTPRI